MSDDEIVKRINEQCSIAALLKIFGREAKARLFAMHVLRLLYTHRKAVERWTEAHRLREG